MLVSSILMMAEKTWIYIIGEFQPNTLAQDGLLHFPRVRFLKIGEKCDWKCLQNAIKPVVVAND